MASKRRGRKETEFDKLARLIKRESEDIRATMATKNDVTSLYRMMATKEELVELRRDMATRADVEEAKDEIMEVLHPIQRAVDKDALMVVDHERRIARVEKQVSAR